jgi:hypothetical protein
MPLRKKSRIQPPVRKVLLLQEKGMEGLEWLFISTGLDG